MTSNHYGKIRLLGVDPAQHKDYAGFSIGEAIVWINPKTGTYKKDPFGYPLVQLNFRWLDRDKKLHDDELVDKIRKLIRNNGINMVVLDNTGIGSSTGDHLIHAGLEGAILKRVCFCGGQTEPNREPSPILHTHNVSKSQIVASHISMFEMGRIQISPKLPLAKIAEREHLGYRVKITVASNQIYINQDSENDDILCSMALCSLVVNRLWGLRYLPQLMSLEEMQLEDDHISLSEEVDGKEMATQMQEDIDQESEKNKKSAREFMAQVEAEMKDELRRKRESEERCGERELEDKIQELRKRAKSIDRDMACWNDPEGGF
jgi:hypothetical protein